MPRQWIAVGAAALMAIAAAFLIVDRGGLLAWLGAAAAALLLFKSLRRPSPRDPLLSVALLVVWILSWGLTWNYVMSTWESGEVVQLEIAGGHTARVWVLDAEGGPILYYDAPPEAAGPLLAGTPLSIDRGGQVRQACARATPVDDLPDEQVQGLIQQLEEKYEGRNRATDVFYVVLGVQRDRVGLLVELTPCG